MRLFVQPRHHDPIYKTRRQIAKRFPYNPDANTQRLSNLRMRSIQLIVPPYVVAARSTVTLIEKLNKLEGQQISMRDCRPGQ